MPRPYPPGFAAGLSIWFANYIGAAVERGLPPPAGHQVGLAGGYAQLAVNVHRLRAGGMEVVADLADVIWSKESVRRDR